MRFLQQQELRAITGKDIIIIQLKFLSCMYIHVSAGPIPLVFNKKLIWRDSTTNCCHGDDL